MGLKKTIFYLLLLFFISSLLVPVAFYNKIFFISIIAILFLITTPRQKIETYAPFFIFFIFLYGYILSFFNYSSRPLSTQLFISVLVLFMIYIVAFYNINMDRIIKISGIVLAVFTGIFYYVLTIGQGSFYAEIFRSVFEQYSLGAIGERSFSEESTLMFHLGTTPFLYLPFSLYFISFLKAKKWKYFIALIILGLAILSSASRGLIIATFLSMLIILFFLSGRVVRLMFIGVTVPVIIFIIQYLNSNTLILSSTEQSNSAKIGHAISFVDQITLMNFFTGSGLGAYYYSIGKNGLAAETEITPLDMLRYLGFLFGPLLYLVILVPSKRLSNYQGENRMYVIIFIIYLLLSFTNPILFNSFGLLIVLWYWSKILKTGSATPTYHSAIS